MDGLDMGGDEAGAHLELLQRHAGDDAGALDRAVARDTVIAIQSSQQGRLAGAVSAVDDPAFACVDFEREVFEGLVFVEVDVGVAELDERLGGGSR